MSANKNINKQFNKEQQRHNTNDRLTKAAQIVRNLTQNPQAYAPTHLSRYAEMLVAPDVSEPVRAPSLYPMRSALSRYTLNTTITGISDYGIIVRPTVSDPILISDALTIAPESDFEVDSRWTYVGVPDPNGPMEMVFKSAVDDKQNLSRIIDGKQALPLKADASGSNLDFIVTAGNGSGDWHYYLYAYDGTAWNLVEDSDKHAEDYSSSHSGKQWNSNYTHYSLEVVCQLSDLYTFQLEMKISSAKATSKENYNETNMKALTFPWKSALKAADAVKVTAMSCLVSYHGADLENSGDIAVCSAPPNLPITGGFYTTITERSYDMYDGRLASSGGQVGGAHWHMLPTSLDQLDFKDAGLAGIDDSTQVAYFGIRGMQPDQSVRLKFTAVLEFRTMDPTFHTSPAPPLQNFSALLYALHENVSTVSCNDKHGNKITKASKAALKTAMKAAHNVYDNKDELEKVGSTLMKLLPLLIA
jgi:hypothetical protein